MQDRFERKCGIALAGPPGKDPEGDWSAVHAIIATVLHAFDPPRPDPVPAVRGVNRVTGPRKGQVVTRGIRSADGVGRPIGRMPTTMSRGTSVALRAWWMIQTLSSMLR